MTKLAIDLNLSLESFRLELTEDLELDGVTAVFGPSGAGKTTLLRVLAGLERRAAGRVSLGGAVWQDTDGGRFVPPHERRLGYVFQDGRLFSHLSVEGNLLFAEDRARRRAAQSGDGNSITASGVIKSLELEGLLERRPDSLSGGEQQRVAMARALLTNPHLLLMDEPLSALDLRRKTEIIPYIERLTDDFQIPVLYVTHNVEEVTRLASRIVLLADGRIVARGGVAEVLERVELWPLTGRLEAGTVLEAAVGETVNGMTSLDVEGEALRVPAIDIAVGAQVRLRVQARDVALATERPQSLSIRNILHARILNIGLDETVFAEVLLEVGKQHLRSRVTREAVEDLGLEEGQQLFALIKSVAFEGRLLS